MSSNTAPFERCILKKASPVAALSLSKWWVSLARLPLEHVEDALVDKGEVAGVTRRAFHIGVFAACVLSPHVQSLEVTRRRRTVGQKQRSNQRTSRRRCRDFQNAGRRRLSCKSLLFFGASSRSCGQRSAGSSYHSHRSRLFRSFRSMPARRFTQLAGELMHVNRPIGPSV